MHVVGGRFDEHRNTSRVFGVLPGAGEVAAKACRAWTAANPAHAQWIIDGHPTLTEPEHQARFGEKYRKQTSKQ